MMRIKRDLFVHEFPGLFWFWRAEDEKFSKKRGFVDRQVSWHAERMDS